MYWMQRGQRKESDELSLGIIELQRCALCPGRVAQLVGVATPPHKVAGFIPCQGTYLGCGFDPQSLLSLVWAR